MALQLQDLQRELAAMKCSYTLELDRLAQKVADVHKNLTIRDQVSDHDAFNMSAMTQNLAVLAGKIAQTENVIRWSSTS